jgi:hypothetical protein
MYSILDWKSLSAILSSRASVPNLEVENQRMEAKETQKPYDISTIRSSREVSVHRQRENSRSRSQESSKATRTLMLLMLSGGIGQLTITYSQHGKAS